MVIFFHGYAVEIVLFVTKPLALATALAILKSLFRCGQHIQKEYYNLLVAIYYWYFKILPYLLLLAK